MNANETDNIIEEFNKLNISADNTAEFNLDKYFELLEIQIKNILFRVY
jgi:hypothetical protein